MGQSNSFLFGLTWAQASLAIGGVLLLLAGVAIWRLTHRSL